MVDHTSPSTVVLMWEEKEGKRKHVSGRVSRPKRKEIYRLSFSAAVVQMGLVPFDKGE